ncbi:COG1361 S-layer family protein [Candidatus Woesearchaeota archaeon]|nr:COG1361 S-layer family protein [Candidatus Woesearchaeota archaeon]
MERKNISAVIIALFVLCAAVAAAQVGSLAELDFTLISQDPDPVGAGEIVDLRWKIENTGGGTAEDVDVELIAEYPFSLYSGDLIKNIGVIEGGQTGDKAVLILYKVRVDENAIEGTGEIKLRYRTAKTGWVELDPFDINIRTSDPVLSIEEIMIHPAVAAPGENIKALLNIKNLADSFMKDITIKLDVSSEDVPFAPIQSVTEKRIKQMSSGAEEELSYDLIVEPDAALGVYKIPVEMEYTDSTGISHEKTDLIGVVIGATPDLSYYVDATTINTAGNKGEITVKFVNKGLSDVKFLNVILKESDDYSILSQEEVYIGNIDSDDYETADFDLYIKSDAPSEVNLPLEITYKDSNNKDYKEEKDITLKLYGSKEAEKLGIEEKDNRTGIIIAVVIVVVIIVAYIIYRKKKKKKQ